MWCFSVEVAGPVSDLLICVKSTALGVCFFYFNCLVSLPTGFAFLCSSPVCLTSRVSWRKHRFMCQVLDTKRSARCLGRACHSWLTTVAASMCVCPCVRLIVWPVARVIRSRPDKPATLGAGQHTILTWCEYSLFCLFSCLSLRLFGSNGFNISGTGGGFVVDEFIVQIMMRHTNCLSGGVSRCAASR